jgi:hypothetical protein
MTKPTSSSSRDAALRRLGRCNRWLLAGSATLTGAFTLLAAQAFPGKSASAATKGASKRQDGSARASGRSTKEQATNSTGSTEALKAASQSPQAASSTPVETAKTTTTETQIPSASSESSASSSSETSSESGTAVSGGS